jgi:ABC-type multidrug transport system ATPase subunit
MDVLAGRKTGGVASGEVHVNGFPKNQKTFARVAGYCEQEDVHLPTATVAEALAFSATLRLPSTVSAETRNEFIEEVGGWVGGWVTQCNPRCLLLTLASPRPASPFLLPRCRCWR